MQEAGRIAHGGVSAVPYAPVLYGTRTVVAAAPSPGGAFPNFVNNGGPFLDTSIVFTSFCDDVQTNGSTYCLSKGAEQGRGLDNISNAI